MKNNFVRYAGLSVMMIVLILVAVNGAAVLAQTPDSMKGPELVYVTSPAEGETVSNIVTVTGAVDFTDFLKYELFLRSGDQLVWGATVYAPVINGVLARLDTKIFMDGTYQIVIRKVTPDSNYTDFVGPSMTIANNLGAPLPHPEIESNPLYPPQSGHALFRIKNCTGRDLEFDYQGQSSGCSHADLWMMPKLHEMPLCTSKDVLLVPCEYRGSVVAQGEERGATYSFVAEAGKIYMADYAGNGKLYLGEIKGDERASTDVGGLDPQDPLRLGAMAPQAAAVVKATVAEGAPAVGAVALPAPANPPVSVEAPAIAAPTPSSGQPTEAEAMLPISGRAGNETSIYFIISGVVLILLMIVGGVVAMRRGKQAA